MNGRTCDLAIVGGGLSGSLAALALVRKRPDVSVRMIEAGDAIGGNHRWSWFGSDLSTEGEDLLSPISKNVWEGGNEVAFPEYRRQLSTPYFSMSSQSLARTLARELPEDVVVLRRRATALDATGVTLEDGTRITARAVVDARGFAPTAHLQGGWQVFMGRHVRLATSHGIDRPTIMDAQVEQLDGYRFVYVLPLGEQELFIEDTYYQDTPRLDRSALSSRIDSYAGEHGCDGEIIGSETGVLPVITGGDFRRFQVQNRVEGVTMLGARGGFTHPLTSYTLPFAVQCALAIAEDADLPGDQLANKMEARARLHWNAMGFYRLLGSMLFGATPPQERVRVFQRFYRMPEGLIERFYAGQSTLADKARLLIGRPPVPISGALKALASKRPPLTHSSESKTA